MASWLRCGLTALSAALLCTGLGCGSKPDQVHFVLPNGWRGGFAIKPDDPNGVELKPNDGKYILTIPDSGVLRIKGHDPFRSYLNTASFKSGESIWVSKALGDEPAVGIVALWDVGSKEEKENGTPVSWYWWFVGTKEEWKAATYETRYKPGGITHKGNR